MQPCFCRLSDHCRMLRAFFFFFSFGRQHPAATPAPSMWPLQWWWRSHSLKGGGAHACMHLDMQCARSRPLHGFVGAVDRLVLYRRTPVGLFALLGRPAFTSPRSPAWNSWNSHCDRAGVFAASLWRR
ncbi:hypothetical protein SORBI_3001G120700 [Sorghum bicolor]|uniref:Uncharacterized protein n=1 Tax=Sorghum bicolor TaxID=4558 RepID=A0A1B6QIM0_SORBI|nr:hypothetical protein SORBI_3001G120700 [Sorghum bicolor]